MTSPLKLFIDFKFTDIRWKCDLLSLSLVTNFGLDSWSLSLIICSYNHWLYLLTIIKSIHHILDLTTSCLVSSFWYVSNNNKSLFTFVCNVRVRQCHLVIVSVAVFVLVQQTGCQMQTFDSVKSIWNTWTLVNLTFEQCLEWHSRLAARLMSFLVSGFDWDFHCFIYFLI